MTESDSGGEPRGPRIAGTIEGALQTCWSCGRSVTSRAFFCHSCGAVQPPRPVDHFGRLGLERRFDLDLDHLARQHTGLGRALDPERFSLRGARQQTMARQQAHALDAAYEVLRDPVRRARYLLDLIGEPAAEALADPQAEELAAELAAAADGPAVDRIGADIANRTARCITDIAAAFRSGDTPEAAQALTRLEALERLAAAARDRRAALKPGP